MTAKSAGYGLPIRIDVELGGQRRSFVLHGSSANQFGHDRRAERAGGLLLAADTFGSIPRHTHAPEHAEVLATNGRDEQAVMRVLALLEPRSEERRH